MEGGGYVNEEGTAEEHEAYGDTEREVGMKLLAAHAMLDRSFFDRLREDPVTAAAELHIALDKKDLEYLATVDWDRLAEIHEPTLTSLGELKRITNSW